ncbi:uncharacterized protein LOC125033265 [Penaeus chinensis]|uniref:uncharacterized protein LOC125033265 n=1 Tax=Penaeus chinensis TaxID=139456 RepID=UPI001FB6D6B2|nr:uncharacterized protein LOC125033265 [Penaeus chinensis]
MNPRAPSVSPTDTFLVSRSFVDLCYSPCDNYHAETLASRHHWYSHSLTPTHRQQQPQPSSTLVRQITRWTTYKCSILVENSNLQSLCHSSPSSGVWAQADESQAEQMFTALEAFRLRSRKRS